MADDPEVNEPETPPAEAPDNTPAEPAPADPPADPPPPASDDWRAPIQDEKLRNHAGQFTSVLDLVGKHYELRQKLSTAIQPLGKDPTDDQVAAYRKVSGIPETVDGYKFSLPEGHEITDADKAFQTAASQAFHKFDISTKQAEGLSGWWNEVQAAGLQAQIDGDKAFAEESMTALKTEWPGEEFDRNKAFADHAANAVFAENLDEVRNIETKDGRFVLDHPVFLKMLAQYGREMQEGRLDGMSETETDNVETEIDDLEKKIDSARWEGDSVKANELYLKQQKLYEKRFGSAPIVGDAGRTA